MFAHLLRALVVSAAAVLPCVATAADGIASDTAFRVPFMVNGKATANKATITVSADGKSTLRVLYASGEDICEAFYSLERKDAPKPEPKPEPLPVPTTLWGIVVEESSKQVPEQAIVLTSPRVRALFTNQPLRVIDKDTEVAPALQPYADRAKGKALPMLFLVDDKGTIYYEGPLPATVEAMIDLYNEKKGGGK